jgi:hypothetical protein
MKAKIILLLRLIAAGILLQTLFFKYIFSTLGVEPLGRLLSGVVELIASVLLLVPATQILGALMGIAVMAGAILSHLLILGIVIQNDGGLLFSLACAVLISCLLVLGLQPEQVRIWIARALSLLKSAVK